MLARLMSRVGVAAKSRAHAAQFVRGDISANAAPADDYAYVNLAVLYSLSHSERVVWIIIRHIPVVRAEVFYLMTSGAQLFNHALVERKASMICADCYSHDENL